MIGRIFQESACLSWVDLRKLKSLTGQSNFGLIKIVNKVHTIRRLDVHDQTPFSFLIYINVTKAFLNHWMVQLLHSFNLLYLLSVFNAFQTTLFWQSSRYEFKNAFFLNLLRETNNLLHQFSSQPSRNRLPHYTQDDQRYWI